MAQPVILFLFCLSIIPELLRPLLILCCEASPIAFYYIFCVGYWPYVPLFREPRACYLLRIHSRCASIIAFSCCSSLAEIFPLGICSFFNSRRLAVQPLRHTFHWYVRGRDAFEFTDCSRYLRCESFHADMSTPAALSVSVAINAVPSLHSYFLAVKTLSTLLLMVHSILYSEAVSSSQGKLLGP